MGTWSQKKSVSCTMKSAISTLAKQFSHLVVAFLSLVNKKIFISALHNAPEINIWKPKRCIEIVKKKLEKISDAKITDIDFKKEIFPFNLNQAQNRKKSLLFSVTFEESAEISSLPRDVEF